MQNFEIKEDGTICLWMMKCIEGGGHTSECYELVIEDGKLKAKKPEESE